MAVPVAQAPEGVARRAGEEVDVRALPHHPRGEVTGVLLALAEELEHVAVERAEEPLALRFVLHDAGEGVDGLGGDIGQEELEVDDIPRRDGVAEDSALGGDALRVAGDLGGVEGDARLPPPFGDGGVCLVVPTEPLSEGVEGGLAVVTVLALVGAPVHPLLGSPARDMVAQDPVRVGGGLDVLYVLA